MDSNKFRSILVKSKVDVWTLIDMAISVASTDYETEFKRRRGAIVERLFTPVDLRCRNCAVNLDARPSSNGLDNYKHHRQTEANNSNGDEVKRSFTKSPESLDRVEEDDTRRRISAIKERLQDPNQSEDCLVNLLHSLSRMEITFEALKETDIGRQVNRLRKHSSNEVRGLVKQLVRKWKDVVDEWVRLSTPGETTALLMPVADRDSPYQNHQKDNGHGRHQEAPTRPFQPMFASSPHIVTPNKQREEKKSFIDSEKLASATRRLHENYQNAQNAKRQRTVQVMDLQDIPRQRTHS